MRHLRQVCQRAVNRIFGVDPSQLTTIELAEFLDRSARELEDQVALPA
jgi:hypothetical protein